MLILPNTNVTEGVILDANGQPTSVPTKDNRSDVDDLRPLD